MTAQPHPNRLGELVGGKYRIVRFLAEGGMGVVYEAQHAVIGRRFAVKFLRSDLAARRDILSRFQREAHAAGALESENVTAAVDFGVVTDGTPYIVMEYLVGENLASLLERERRLPVSRAADLCFQACRGIQAAHAAGIVHRDLKPQNLFVCRREDGTDVLKVLDFGVAKLQAIDDKSAATRTGTIVGTASYMSPEQARGDKGIDHRTDVYALGAILYEMLSGRKPHPGESQNAVLYHISTQPAVSLDSVQPGLPAPLVEIVERALSSDPDVRLASAETLGQALAPLRRREVWPEAAPAPNLDVPTIVAPGNAAAPARPRPRALIALGVGAVAATIVIAIGMTHRAASTPPGSIGDQTALGTAPAVDAPASLRVFVEARAPALPSARLAPAAPPAGRPTGRPPGRPPGRPAARGPGPRGAVALPPPSVSEPPRPVVKSGPVPATFDQKNPYD